MPTTSKLAGFLPRPGRRPHGTWGLFLERAGIGERQAQRLMQLAASGLKPDTVTSLGGVKEALRFIAWLKANERVDRAEQAAEAVIGGRRILAAIMADPAPITAGPLIPRLLEAMLDAGQEPTREALDAELARLAR